MIHCCIGSGGAAGALPFGVDGSDPALYTFQRPAIDGFREIHTDYEPVFVEEEDLWSFGFNYEFDTFNLNLLGLSQTRDYHSRQDYQMDVGPSLGPTPFNPSGLWPVSEPADFFAGADWLPGPCNLNDGTSGVYGGCILPVDQTRVFAYDQSDTEVEYWTVEGRIQTTLDGPFNFQIGASAYDRVSHGDYYVLANTLDMVSVYGSPALGAPPFESRGEVSDEYIRAFKELWTKEHPEFDGKYCSFSDIVFEPKPVQKPHPPIWIGGESTRALRRAASLGDGWCPAGVSREHPLRTAAQLSRSIDRLRRYAEDAGRDHSEIEVVYHGAAYRDREEQMVDGERSMFTGSQSQVAEDIRELEGMGVQNVMLEIVGKDLDATLERMEQFASRAMPLARSGG